jgi:hypothetical protein
MAMHSLPASAFVQHLEMLWVSSFLAAPFEGFKKPWFM